ncbi:MAG TPA: tetratricopeptide repeat protein, partial [Acidobacteriaceae bacterium]
MQWLRKITYCSFLFGALCVCAALAQATRPGTSPDAAELGRSLVLEHREVEALPYLEEALRGGDKSTELRDMTVKAAEAVALRQRAAGHRDDALATLLAARAAIPDSFTILFDLGIVEDELRLYRDAERAITEARRIEPGDLKALYAEARVKMDLEDMPAAERDMREYLKARPEDPTAHYGLGRILEMTQRSEEAKTEFERSIALAPKQAESYYQIGQIALDHGDYATAQRECRKALEHD